jgi:hypothetical protein
MDYLARKPIVARAMGEYGRPKLEKRFSWETKMANVGHLLECGEGYLEGDCSSFAIDVVAS